MHRLDLQTVTSAATATVLPLLPLPRLVDTDPDVLFEEISQIEAALEMLEGTGVTFVTDVLTRRHAALTELARSPW